MHLLGNGQTQAPYRSPTALGENVYDSCMELIINWLKSFINTKYIDYTLVVISINY